MSITRLGGAEGSQYLRCDRVAVARRQLEMSIGLIVILLIAAFVAAIVVPLKYGKAPQLMAKTSAVVVSMKRDGVVRTPVKVIPIYSSQALRQTPSSGRS